MSNNLLASLGLDKVDADPNAIPDGRYDGVVFKDEYVLSSNKDTLSHVVSYKVEGGQYNGATPAQQWFTLGDAPRDADGNFPQRASDVVTYNPTMSEQQKQWYKKHFVDLGVREQDIPETEIGSNVGKKVTFGLKKNGAYLNINFVELREGTPAGPTTPVQAGNVTSQL